MFLLHFLIVGGNLLFFVAYATLLQIGSKRVGDAKLTIDGFANICGIINSVFEVAGFLLVLYV